MKYRFVLLQTILIAVLPVFIGVSFIISTLIANRLEKMISDEMYNTTRMIRSSIEASARANIKSHLLEIAEKNLALAWYVWDRHLSGELTEEEAINEIHGIFIKQKVGSSGYLYCLDSTGVLKFHPFKGLIGTSQMEHEHVRKQIELKKGYIEYDWKNPGEEKTRAKAIYMLYFEPLDYIISVSSYRSEFNELVDIPLFRDYILSMRFRESGYAYILDLDGKIVIHPFFETGVNLMEESLRIDPQFRDIVRTQIETRRGSLRYLWKNPTEPEPRWKLAVYETLSDFEWLVGSSCYIDEVFEPQNEVSMILSLAFLVAILLVTAAVFGISRQTSRPLNRMVSLIERADYGDISDGFPPSSIDEFRFLTERFNGFLKTQTRTMDQLRQKETALRRERDFTRLLINGTPAYIVGIDQGGRIMLINNTCASVLGRATEELEGKDFIRCGVPEYAHEETRKIITSQLAWLGEMKSPGGTCEFPIVSASGEVYQVQWVGTTVHDPDTDSVFLLEVGIDVTLQKEMAEKLSRADILNAIGQLAGGVAHDFNNLLCGIIGAADILSDTLNESEESKACLDIILNASDRAAILIKKLLVFARKGVQAKIDLSPLNLGNVVKDTAELLGRTIDKKVEIRVDIHAEDLVILGEESLIQNALVNIGVNSEHAMPKGGILTFTVENRVLNKEYCNSSPFDIQPGLFITVEISDTGVGMDSATLSQIFEPFFTTREVGKGSGLGLATVYAMVQQHKGIIDVASSPGKGTQFTLLFPVTSDKPKGMNKLPEVPMGEGTVLVIDDEVSVRDVMVRTLENLGYKVIIATDGKEGVDRYTDLMAEIDCVILDMLMPKMSGRQVFNCIRELNPKVPVIIASGYSQKEELDLEFVDSISAFLKKPFRKKDLAQIIASVMT